MSRIIFFAILMAFYLAIDVYSYYGLKSAFGPSKAYNYSYWAISLLFFAGIFVTFQALQGHQGVRPLWVNLAIGVVFTIFVTKLIFGGMLLVYDLGRLAMGGMQWLGSSLDIVKKDEGLLPKRRQLITGIIAGITALPFIGMLHGITRGKYNYQVNKVKLAFKDLPSAFDGFRIVQISDIHSGSYDSIDQVQKGIDLVNELDADMLVFTGDLVNSTKNEIDPYINAFRSANGKEGKFSITGNHDYYGFRNSQNESREEYWKDFHSKHEQMGFDLLKNENRLVKRGEDSLRIVGVENWGLGPFPRHGDLDKALVGVDKDEFTILLSHDPTHWDEHALPHKKNIHLTLSGHTHGMQFGISALGIKWSPIKYRYKKWAGLYTKDEQHLYINKGFGFLGLPGRIGMYPEITEFEFVKV